MLMSSRRLNWVELVLNLQYDTEKLKTGPRKQGVLCYFTIHGVEIGVVIINLCLTCVMRKSGFRVELGRTRPAQLS